jgi:hypothetical protein
MENNSCRRGSSVSFSGGADDYRRISQDHRKKEKDAFNPEPLVEKVANVNKALKKHKRCKNSDFEKKKKNKKKEDIPVWIKMMEHPDNFSRKPKGNSYREFNNDET